MKSLVVTYLLTYGGAAASLFNPFIGLCVYIGFAVVIPEGLWFYSLPLGGNLSRIVAISLLIGWTFKGFGNWQFGKAHGIVMALVGYWLWCILGALAGGLDEAAQKFVEELTKVVLPFLAGITIIDSLARTKTLAWVIVLSHGYLAYEANLAFYAGVNIQTDGFGGRGNGGLSVTMVAAIGMAFFLGVHAQRWWQKALAFCAAALIAHVILFSFSRGAMLALLATITVAFILMAKSPKTFVSLVAGVLLVSALAGPSVRERFATTFAGEDDRDTSAQSRIELWANCIDSIGKRPLFGLGPGHWPLIAEEYGWPPGKEAHCLWLQVAAELGLPGLAFLVSFYILPIVRLWPLTRAGNSPSASAFREPACMLIPSLVGFLVAAQFVTVSGLEPPYYIVLVGAAALKLASTRPPVPADSSSQSRLTNPEQRASVLAQSR
jgi:O-Antigen ligase